VLLDAIVQFAGQAFTLLVHGQSADLVAQAGTVLAQFVQVLLVLFQVLGQEVELLVEDAQLVTHRVGDSLREVPAQPGLADLGGASQSAYERSASP